MLNTEEDILTNQELLVPTDFHSRETNIMEVNGDHQLFFKISSFVFNRNS